MRAKDKEQGIDFVIAWVDGNDPEWQEEKKNTRIQKGIFIEFQIYQKILCILMMICFY